MSTLDRLAALPPLEKARPASALRFGLIVPPSPYVVPPGWEWVHRAPFEGPSVIAALLKRLGYGVSLLDQREDPDPASLEAKLRGVDVVGIATYEDNFPYLRRAAEIAKKQAPERPVVLGGPLVSSAPKLLLENTAADYAVVGEGELTTIELMDLLAKAEDALPVAQIAGLAWKDAAGAAHLNRHRMQMEQLDAVPIQDLEAWESLAGKPIPQVYLSYSRGCASACSFCYRAMPKLRLKTPARVRAEIEALKRFGFEMAWWNDLTFTTDHAYVHRLMDEAFTAHDFRWCAFSRVDSVDVPVLEHMKQRGCDLILYGFESISADILDSFRKRISKHAIVDAIELNRKVGLKVGGLFIIGAPDETPESLARLEAFCREFKEVTRVKYLSALPGTPLYHQALREGWIKSELAHLDFLSRERSVEEDVEEEGFVKFSDHVTLEQLRATYRGIEGLIERRPYDYRNQANVFLESPIASAKRPVTSR